MPTPPDKPVKDEIAEARARTDDQWVGVDDYCHKIMYLNAACVHAERKAADARIAALEAALKGTLELVAANRLMLGHYMGVEWLSREEKLWRSTLSRRST